MEDGDPVALENVNYFVIKYKIAPGTDCDIALDYASGGEWQWLGSLNDGGKNLLVADGEWHTLVFHLASRTPYTCKVYFNTGDVEIAYAGFVNILG